CAGFILIPLIGKENGLRLVVGLQLVSSLAVAGILMYKGRKGVLRLVPVALTALIGVGLCFYFPQWNHRLLATSKYHRFEWIEGEVKRSNWVEALLYGPQILTRSEWGDLVYYGDGIGGFTTVIKNSDAMGNTKFTMANSGKADASSHGDMDTQTLSAHFPMLFHKNPRSVMVLGLASGITAGDVLCYPVDKLDVIDINEQVVRASDHFLPWNNNVLSDPRTNLIIQDGRAHLNLTREKYDVIISEPSNPWMAGLAALFTRDFFDLAKDRLNEDGIFVQFIHSYQMDWPTFSLVGRTLAKVFPNSLLLMSEPSGKGFDYLIVGFKGEDGLTLENAKKNFPFVQNSKNISLSDPRLLYRLIVSEDLEGLFGPGPVNTDSRPLLEFSAPKLIHREHSNIIRELKSGRWLSPEIKNIVHLVTTDIDAQIGFAAYAFSVYSPFIDMVDLTNATASQKERYWGLLEEYYTTNEFSKHLDTSLLQRLGLMERVRTIQTDILQAKVDLMPDRVLSYIYLGYLYLEDNMPDKAIINFTKALEIDPDNPEAHNNLGVAFARQGKLDDAVMSFEAVLQVKPDHIEAHNNLGNILIRQEKVNRGITYFKDALQIDPSCVAAQKNLGVAFARQDKLEEAVKAYKRAIELEPDDPDTCNELGVLLARQTRYDEAKIYLEKAIQSDPTMADPHVTLGKIFIKQGRFDQAEMHFDKAIGMRPDLAGLLAKILLEKGRLEAALKYLKATLKIEPERLDTMNDLAWILATHKKDSVREPHEAIRFAEKACELTDYARHDFVDTLAVAYASAGRFSEAVNMAEKAMELVSSSELQVQSSLEIKKHLQLFRAGRPYIENPS
ncbi:MAG: tetratricopeptide repeat protein, partial [Deltaproteobacteria bacterium]|nr:tetratricopeptide repeat protein [Deltaproteobacteria bacterium]